VNIYQNAALGLVCTFIMTSLCFSVVFLLWIISITVTHTHGF